MIFKFLDDRGRFCGYGGTCSDGSIRGYRPGSSGLHTFRPANPEPERPYNPALFASTRGERRRQRAKAEAEKNRLSAQRGY